MSTPESRYADLFWHVTWKTDTIPQWSLFTPEARRAIIQSLLGDPSEPTTLPTAGHWWTRCYENAKTTGVLGFFHDTAINAYINDLIKAMPNWAFEEER